MYCYCVQEDQTKIMQLNCARWQHSAARQT